MRGCNYLARQAGDKMQRDAANVPDSQISDYYQQHASDYKTISFDRIFIPKQKEADADKPNELIPQRRTKPPKLK